MVKCNYCPKQNIVKDRFNEHRRPVDNPSKNPTLSQNIFLLMITALKTLHLFH